MQLEVSLFEQTTEMTTIQLMYLVVTSMTYPSKRKLLQSHFNQPGRSHLLTQTMLKFQMACSGTSGYGSHTGPAKSLVEPTIPL